MSQVIAPFHFRSRYFGKKCSLSRGFPLNDYPLSWMGSFFDSVVQYVATLTLPT